jgi:hypothetical protein
MRARIGSRRTTTGDSTIRVIGKAIVVSSCTIIGGITATSATKIAGVIRIVAMMDARRTDQTRIAIGKQTYGGGALRLVAVSR